MSALRRVRVADDAGCYDFIGTFLGWGVDFEELLSGTGHFTVALIEKSDGHVEMVPPAYMQFLTDSEAKP